MKVVVISISGGSGSGKTTVVNKIVSSFKKREVRVLRLDDYYKKSDLPLEERAKINYDHPNSLDFDLFISQIKELCEGKTINKPLYDYIIHNRKEETEEIENDPIDYSSILSEMNNRLENIETFAVAYNEGINGLLANLYFIDFVAFTVFVFLMLFVVIKFFKTFF